MLFVRATMLFGLGEGVATLVTKPFTVIWLLLCIVNLCFKRCNPRQGRLANEGVACFFKLGGKRFPYEGIPNLE